MVPYFNRVSSAFLAGARSLLPLFAGARLVLPRPAPEYVSGSCRNHVGPSWDWNPVLFSPPGTDRPGPSEAGIPGVQGCGCVCVRSCGWVCVRARMFMYVCTFRLVWSPLVTFRRGARPSTSAATTRSRRRPRGRPRARRLLRSDRGRTLRWSPSSRRRRTAALPSNERTCACDVRSLVHPLWGWREVGSWCGVGVRVGVGVGIPTNHYNNLAPRLRNRTLARGTSLPN